MCIPPFLEKAEQVRPYFRRLKDLRDELAATLGLALPVVSMGMSHDFEVAIEEGATEVRVGTALFEGAAASEQGRNRWGNGGSIKSAAASAGG